MINQLHLNMYYDRIAWAGQLQSSRVQFLVSPRVLSGQASLHISGQADGTPPRPPWLICNIQSEYTTSFYGGILQIGVR